MTVLRGPDEQVAVLKRQIVQQALANGSRGPGSNLHIGSKSRCPGPPHLGTGDGGDSTRAARPPSPSIPARMAPIPVPAPVPRTGPAHHLGFGLRTPPHPATFLQRPLQPEKTIHRLKLSLDIGMLSYNNRLIVTNQSPRHNPPQ